MTAEVQAEIGAWLAQHLDDIAPDMDLMGYPFRVAFRFREQRNEWARRCALALSIADEMPCSCPRPPSRRDRRCYRCELQQALAGDI